MISDLEYKANTLINAHWDDHYFRERAQEAYYTYKTAVEDFVRAVTAEDKPQHHYVYTQNGRTYLIEISDVGEDIQIRQLKWIGDVR